MFFDNINFEVRDKEVEELLTLIGRRLKFAMPKNYGFALLIFTLGEGGSMFYTSSAERESMIKAMKELITKLEASDGQF